MIRVAGGAANKEVVSLIVLEQAQFPKLRKLTVTSTTSLTRYFSSRFGSYVDTNLASQAGFLTDTFGEGKLGEIIHDFYTPLAAYQAENWTEVHGELIGTPNPLPAPEFLLVFASVHTTLILPSQLGVLLHHAAQQHGFEFEQDEGRGILNKRGFVTYPIARRRINPYLRPLNPTTSD
ncbi:hypothetical protein Rt10032_c15g5415 [Rhodotorula toruloides]|uniref:Uncharacterized protein n=1 Tax=Rhodotorula toruloides TaxID=5286 RepID=A0A511KLZ1_RHOTO|nr:hypothetical protein Rt10032_c15g5415 [Rhodotorula toruloides]